MSALPRPVALLLLPSLLAAGPAQAQKLKLAVLPVKLAKSARGKVPRLIDELVLTAVQSRGDFDVVGQDDLNALLDFEQQKDVLGCDDAACLANLGGALGVDKIIVVKVALVGKEWVSTSKLIDIKVARVDARANTFLPGPGAKRLLEGVPRIVDELLRAAPASALQPPESPAEPEPVQPDSAPPPVETAPPPAATPPPATTTPPTVETKPPAPPPSRAAESELGVSGRVELDALGPGIAFGAALDYLGETWGISATVIYPSLGFRGEGRFFFIHGDAFRMFAGLGLTYFPVSSLGLRGAFGAQLKFGPLALCVDLGYELFVVNEDVYNTHALLLGVGAGFAF